MKRKIHAVAGFLAFSFIAAFWLSTAISEAFMSAEAVTTVKNAILYALIVFIPIMIATGGSGFSLAGKSAHPLIAAKRRRMPFIAMNGLLVLVPCAVFLAMKANAGAFDEWFTYVQGLELVAGATNLVLMGLNIRDGRQLTAPRRLRQRTRDAEA